MLAEKFPGTLIRVQWSREDDIKFSYFNAMSHLYLRAALGRRRAGDGLRDA